MSQQSATVGDVLSWRDLMDLPSGAAFEVVWGPVSVEDAGRAGAMQGVESVVIRPALAPSVVAAAMEGVPTELLPRADDTVDLLAARVGASAFLDDAHVLNRGNGKRGATGKRKRLKVPPIQLHAASPGQWWSYQKQWPQTERRWSACTTTAHMAVLRQTCAALRCRCLFSR